VPSPATPQTVEFSASFLGGDTESYALERFQHGNPVMPGTYLVDIHVNGERLARESVTFVDSEVADNASVCFTRELLTVMGVDIEKLGLAEAPVAGCIDLARAIPDAYASYDSSELRLDVSIPQVALTHRPQGYVDPRLWDQGITAFTLGYNLNVTRSDSGSGAATESAYAGLNMGLNLGRWRIRNQGNLSWSKQTGRRYQSISAYAQRDITPWASQLTLGESFTRGAIFDGVGFRGFQLATDERMRPDSSNGFVPVIRGIADTNARVQVRQGSYLVYETTVAPGAFEINDLYATSGGGDLEVLVIEADGRERAFKVPYASVPSLMRPGVWNYSATLGQVRDGSLKSAAPWFVEGTYQRGLSNWVSVYLGAQSTQGDLYRAALLGAAFNTPVGAVSMDITSARTRFDGVGESQNRNGYSARITYNKSIVSTRTDLTVAAYRYSSAGYLNLSDASRYNDRFQIPKIDPKQVIVANERSRFQLSVNQRLGERGGSLGGSINRSEFWSAERPIDYTYQLAWNNTYQRITYGVSASRARLSNGGYDNSYYLSFSVPLGSVARRNVPTLSVNASRRPGSNGLQASVTGSAGQDRQFSYSLSSSLQSGSSDSFGASGTWRAPYATVGASFSRSNGGSSSASVSASGGVVLHAGGATLTPYLGETIGIVKAQGARGARLASDGISRVDRRGYVVASNLMAYRMNDIALDAKGSSLDVELRESRQTIAPRAGSVVALEFMTKTGKAMLIRVAMEDGKAVPFGAHVTDHLGAELGVVGQGGQLFVREGAEKSDAWTISWGGGSQCTLARPAASAQPGTSEAQSDLQIVKAVCKAYRKAG
jgi:outer membrane usher protein